MRFCQIILGVLLTTTVQSQLPEFVLSGETMPSWAKGSDVDIEGDIAAVGVPGGIVDGEKNGFVYVYERQNGRWELNSTLTPDQVQAEDGFGSKVEVFGERIVATADKANRLIDGGIIEQSGMAFVFEKVDGQWVQSAELIPSTVESEDRFGIQVTASAGRIFVSKADFGQSVGESLGGVFVFEYINDLWVETDLITVAETSGAFNTLGLYPMVAQGNTLFVPNVINENVITRYPEVNVYVLSNGGWELEQIITQPSAIPVTNFGSNISVNGDRLLISALPVGSPHNTGRVFLFEPVDGVWTEKTTFRSDGPVIGFNANFGSDIAMGVDQIFIGARSNKPGEFSDLDQGQVLVYDLIDGHWQLSHELEADSNAERDGNNFGSAIALSQNELLVGAPDIDLTGVVDTGSSDRGGAAFIFEIAPNVDTLPINDGLNGSWFNQENAVQGLFLDVSPSLDFSFLGWFTYNNEAVAVENLGQIGADGQRWLVGAGDIDQANATINYNLYYSHDGLFDDPREVTTVDTQSYGSLSIEFHSCNSATVTYDLFKSGVSNSYPIIRPAAGSDTLCVDLATGDNDPLPNGEFDYRLNGAWFNSETPGQGIFIDNFKGVDTAFMGWFTYETTLQTPPDLASIGAAGQRWLVGTGEVDETDVNVLNYQLYYSYGGLFDDALEVLTVEPGSYGDLRIEFVDCANAKVTYNIENPELSGEFSMIRAVPNGQNCELAVE